MNIVVINPNTTAAMTARIGTTAKAVAQPGTHIIAIQPSAGPASIEGYADEAMALPHMLEALYSAQANNPDVAGYVIACFDDTGLDAARCVLDAPVVGIGEAACHMASLLAARLSKEHGVPVIDGVGAAVKLIESLAALGLKTSKCTTYAKPLVKSYAGTVPNFITQK